MPAAADGVFPAEINAEINAEISAEIGPENSIAAARRSP